jgi:hypothetical protein
MKTSQFPRRTLLGVSLSHLALVCGECSQNFLLLRLEYLEEVKRPLLRRTVLFGFSAGQIGLPAEAAIHVIPVPTLPLIVRQRHLLVEIAELDRVLAAGELQASSRVSAGGFDSGKLPVRWSFEQLSGLSKLELASAASDD